MTALTSQKPNWRTPPEWADRIRAALGGYITLDAASDAVANETIKAERFFTKEEDALQLLWFGRFKPGQRNTLFLNAPGDRSGKLVRAFWRKYISSCNMFYASCWLGFNLDQLRFAARPPWGKLVIPKKRIAFIDPDLGTQMKQPPAGSYMIFTGAADIAGFKEDCLLWP